MGKCFSSTVVLMSNAGKKASDSMEEVAALVTSARRRKYHDMATEPHNETDTLPDTAFGIVSDEDEIEQIFSDSEI